MLVVFSGMTLYSRFIEYSTTPQNFDIICLTWMPNDSIPRIKDFTKFMLTKDEAKQILELEIKGEFWTDKFFRIENSTFVSFNHVSMDFKNNMDKPFVEMDIKFGNRIYLDSSLVNERPKVIIIMNHPSKEKFKFYQPLFNSLIVLQTIDGDEFTIHSKSQERNRKKIEIKETNFYSFPYWTSINVELKGADDFELHGFQWLNE